MVPLSQTCLKRPGGHFELPTPCIHPFWLCSGKPQHLCKSTTPGPSPSSFWDPTSFDRCFHPNQRTLPSSPPLPALPFWMTLQSVGANTMRSWNENCQAGPNVKTNPATEIDDYRVQIRVRVGSKTCPMQKRYRNGYAPTDWWFKSFSRAIALLRIVITR